MTTQFTIAVDQDSLRETIDAFKFVGGNTDDAMRIAINKSTPKIRTASSRVIREQVRLTASYVSQRLTIRKATRSKLTGAITAPKKGVLLSRFSTDSLIAGDKVSWLKAPAAPSGGIRVKIKPDGGTKAAPSYDGNNPFYVLLNNKQNVGIAARIGKSRKIKVFAGPSLSQVFQTVRKDVTPQASVEFTKQLIDAMRYILVKQHPPEPIE